MDIVVDVLGDVLVDVDPAKGQYGVIAGYLSIGNRVNVLAPRSRTENKGPVAQTSTTGVFLSQAIPGQTTTTSTMTSTITSSTTLTMTSTTTSTTTSTMTSTVTSTLTMTSTMTSTMASTMNQL